MRSEDSFVVIYDLKSVKHDVKPYVPIRSVELGITEQIYLNHYSCHVMTVILRTGSHTFFFRGDLKFLRTIMF